MPMGSREIILVLIGWIRTFIGPAVLATGTFIVLYFVIRYVAYRIKRRILGSDIEETDPYNQKIADIVGSMVVYVGLAFNILIAFQIMGLDVAILMAGVSFGIGFAMQQILENMMAGFLIVTNPMLKVGETINILGNYNTYGMIEKLASRYTVIRQFNGRKLIIPNVMMMKTPIQTHVRENVVRTEILFTVEHHIPIVELQKLIKDAVNEHEYVVEKEKTLVLPATVDGAGTSYKVFFFFKPKDSPPMFVLQSDVRKIVMRTLNNNKITVPYPKRILDFTPNTELLNA